MTRVGALLSVLFVLLVAAGCSGDEEASSTPLPTTAGPPVGSTAWGADECLYTFSGREYVPTDPCRRTEPNGTVAYFPRGNPTNVLYYEASGYLYYTYDGLNARQPVNGGLVEVEYGGGWMNSDEYAAVVAREEAAANAAEERELAESQRLELEQQYQEIQNRVMDRILAPACNSSYNGCD